jgi:tetratricopeptide (TPR) repeat protein
MEGYQKAVDYFRGAIDLDPTYALAYSGLADANSYQVGLRMADEIFPAARTAARKAIELDSSLAEGHASLGFILLHYDWDWVGAERELRIALELNPNYASAHSTYGRLLSATARFQEAEAEILKAQQLDPLSLAIANGLALHYYLSRRYNLAERQFRRNLSIDPASTHTMSLLAYNYLLQNRLPDAIHQYEQLLANDPDDLDTIPDLARAYASVGRKSDSLYLLAHLQEMAKKRVDVLPTFFAEVYAALGQLDKTFAYLDEAYRERTWQLIFLRVEPVWDPLRGDARFKQLLGKMGL